ncbi:MAG: putative Ig domain-containing protein [Verrucomicrobia bacterium]|nr:putative Ig domain-containing protein [Verrucomicrobiota bacterium]
MSATFNDTTTIVRGIAIQNDGKIILAGEFTKIGATTKNYLARLTPDVPAVNTLTSDANGTLIEWTRSGSAPEIENAEFKMRIPPAIGFTTLLGKGVRTATGWKLDKLRLPGNRIFDIQAKGLARGGLFNSSTSVMSSTSNGQFRPLPVITSSALTPQKVLVGDIGVSFSITATSAIPITYQWKRNNVVILGATNPTYTIPGGVTTAQAGTYTCTVTSTAGSVTAGATTVPGLVAPGALLTVVTPITITKQPVFQAVLPGKPATFAVTVTGTSPQYQWYKGSLAVPIMIGTNLPTFKIPAVSASDENDYWVEITIKDFPAGGLVRSDLVKLYEVTVGATVTAPPVHAIFAMNGPATLTATLASESPPVIQWLKNKAPVKGGTSVPLLIPAIKLTDAGKYTVKATNPVSSQTSTPDAEVAVVDQLSTKDFVIAQNGSVVMTAIAAGNNLTYKWKKVGGALLTDTGTGVMPSVAGSATKTLTIKGLQTTDTASYTCEVSAPGGMLESAVQQVTVTTGPPVISTPFTLPIGMVGTLYDHTVPMDGPAEIRANKFEAKGLPAGLKIDAFSGRITGRPTLAKTVDTTYPVTISAANGSGKALLTQTANLLIRPITGGTALVGTYIGVITPSAPSTGFQDGGRIDLTTTTGGAYSGKVTLGTVVTSFTGGRLNVGVTGIADFNNRNSITIPRRGLPSLTVEFDLNIGSLVLENGQVTDGLVTSTWSGWKNQWSAANKALLYKGYYTMAMTAPAPAPLDLTYPLGDSYAAFTVADAGTLTVVGRLADGTTFTTSSGFVGPTGQIAVYNSLYGTTGGSLWSDGITITSAGATPIGTAPGYLESTVAGSLNWTKRPQTTGFTYAAGFGPLNLTVIGARYATTTITNTNVLGVSVLTNDAQLTYTGANVETEAVSPDLAVRLADRNLFVVPTFASGGNPAKTAISLVATTGILTTSFVVVEDTDPGPGETFVSRTAKGMGIVVRNLGAGTGVGYGHFSLPQSPGNATAQILSGRLRVTDATP